MASPYPTAVHPGVSTSRMSCPVCFDIVPSSRGQEYGECRRCGRVSHYMNFIIGLRHVLESSGDRKLPPGASHVQVDLGIIPEEISEIRSRLDKLDEVEKSLSLLAEVLKDALQA